MSFSFFMSYQMYLVFLISQKDYVHIKKGEASRTGQIVYCVFRGAYLVKRDGLSVKRMAYFGCDISTLRLLCRKH